MGIEQPIPRRSCLRSKRLAGTGSLSAQICESLLCVGHHISISGDGFVAIWLIFSQLVCT